MSAAPSGLDALRRGPGFLNVFGHRGARGVLPENTMPGFRHIAEMGLPAVEFDVLVTADGTAVLTHNPTLSADTTRDGSGAWIEGDGHCIANLTDRQLSGFDVGAIRLGTAYHARFPEQARMDRLPVPLLAELCALAVDYPDLWLNVEIKSNPYFPDQTPDPAALARATIAPLREHGLLDRTLLQSFDWRVIHAVRDQAPQICRAYLTDARPHGPDVVPNVFPNSAWLDGCDLADHDGSLPQAVADLGGHAWCPYVDEVTADDVARAHDLGLLVTVWTVNRPEDIRRMAEIGVDGIITDFPGRAQNVLAAMGLGWRR